jgi:hypothetical protein
MIVKVLTSTQSSLLGILGNIPLEALELVRAPYKVIETLFLPKASVAPQGAVNFHRRELLSRPTLAYDRGGFQQANQQMHVVWHNDKVAHVIPLAVEATQALGHDLGQTALSKHARAVAAIKVGHKLARKGGVELTFQLAARRQPRPPVWQRWIDPVPSKPIVAARVPRLGQILGHGVLGTERHEIRHARLMPMRQIALVDLKFFFRIEELERNRNAGSRHTQRAVRLTSRHISRRLPRAHIAA